MEDRQIFSQVSPVSNYFDTKKADGLRRLASLAKRFVSALNVILKRFGQGRVNGGSNYDSLKVAKCLVSALNVKVKRCFFF